MNSLHIWLTISIFMTLTLWIIAIPKSNDNKIVIGRMTVPLLFIFAFVLRVILAGSYVGFGADIGCFTSWADRMVEIGPGGFYSSDYFSDYPPLYLYVLFVIGLIRKLFSIPTYTPVHLVLLKLPAILADLGVGFCIYRICNKLVGIKSSLCLATLYLLQPVVILNSCLWGQIDSIFTLFLILVCLSLEKQNLLPAMLLFGLGVLLKPQMLIFTPLMIVGVIQYIFRGGFTFRMLMKASAYSLLTAILVILTAFPFGTVKVISQYVDTLGSYPYASVNAYNFWAGMGLNWASQTTSFMGMPAKTWGTIFIVLATVMSIAIGIRLNHLHQKYAVMGAFLIITVFTYSVRMHDRYLYPALALLPLVFAGFCSRQMCRIPSGKGPQGVEQNISSTLRYAFPVVYTLLVSLHFYNCGHVLFFYDPNNYHADAPALKFTGIGMVLCSLFFYFILFRLQTKKEYDPAAKNDSITVVSPAIRIMPESMRMDRGDVICLLITMVIYSLFALHDLGSNVAPTSVYSMEKSKTITLDFSSETKPSSIAYFIAPEHDRPLLIAVTPEEGHEESSFAFSLNHVFTWTKQDLPARCEHISITAQSDKTNVLEFVFLDADGTPILPDNATDYPELFDEQDTYPELISFRNSMYFDEIYHARTAYEFIHGLRSYENTHPPLGKIFISLGVMIFGMTPFGWRIIGTLFGIAMLPMMYLFAKKLTGDRACSLLACWIFAFDFMHFTQTRIATIDVYIVFFIICMYYFLFSFFTLDYGTTKLSKLCLPLGLCGASMGLGVACKWTGVYAGLGMGFLFFAYLYLTYLKQQRQPITKNKGNQKKKTSKAMNNAFFDKTKKIIPLCFVFFVFVPIFLYFTSYVPFRDGTDNPLLKQALDNQNTMYSYHSTLEATHYFASPFYEWPLIVRPIWYYSGVLSETLRQGISSFGNPLVWWIGIPALAYMFYFAIRKKDKRAAFLIVGYLSQYLPWFFVQRLTFIYHYFPCIVFLVLMIGYAFRNLKDFLPKKAFLTVLVVYAVLVFALFLFFYPVLSGQSVDVNFAVKYLRWFKTWVLIAE